MQQDYTGEMIEDMTDSEAAPTEDGKRYITVTDAVFKYHVADTTLRYWLRVGKLKRYRQGRTTMIDEDQLAALVRERGEIRPAD